MEEKEASPRSNSTSPLSKKTIVLGVVNASEIKCKVDRKRRWDQPPINNEDEGPPSSKQFCDGSVGEFVEDSPLENNIRHDDLSNDILEEIPLPPGVVSANDRVTVPTSPSEPVVIKEQIVQTPSDVLNSLDINSSFPITSSFNELNYTEGNRRVTVEIETVEVTPSSCDDESKSNVEIIDPNSVTVESHHQKDDKLIKITEVNCNDDSKSSAPSPAAVSEGEIIDRAQINLHSAGNIDPAVMEVILGISPTRESPQQTLPSQEFIVNTPVSVDKVEEKELDKNLIDVEESIKLKHSESTNELKHELEIQSDSDKTISNKDVCINKAIGMKLKGLVDYDDDSDESSQFSDKLIASESKIKKSTEDISPVCENSLDSKEEEFHDCFEQQTTDESNYDSASLNNAHVASVIDSDDLINNNPLENVNINLDKAKNNEDGKTSIVSSDFSMENTKVQMGGAQGENSLSISTQRIPELSHDNLTHDKCKESIASGESSSLAIDNSDADASGSHYSVKSSKSEDSNQDGKVESSTEMAGSNVEKTDSHSFLPQKHNDADSIIPSSQAFETIVNKSTENDENVDVIRSHVSTSQNLDSVDTKPSEVIENSGKHQESDSSETMNKNRICKTDDDSTGLVLSSQIVNSIGINEHVELKSPKHLGTPDEISSLTSVDRIAQKDTVSPLSCSNKDVNEKLINIDQIQKSVLTDVELKTSDNVLCDAQTAFEEKSIVNTNEKDQEKLVVNKDTLMLHEIEGHLSGADKKLEEVELNDLCSVDDKLNPLKSDCTDLDLNKSKELTKTLLSLNVDTGKSENILAVEKSLDVSPEPSCDYLIADNDTKNDKSNSFLGKSLCTEETNDESREKISVVSKSEFDLTKTSDIEHQDDNNLEMDTCQEKELTSDVSTSSACGTAVNIDKCNEIKDSDIDSPTPASKEDEKLPGDNFETQGKDENIKSESVKPITCKDSEEEMENDQKELGITSFKTKSFPGKIDISKQVNLKVHCPSENNTIEISGTENKLEEKPVDAAVIPDKSISPEIHSKDNSDVRDETKSSLTNLSLTSPQLLVSEKSETSLQSSVDLNMECESVDTDQSIDSINESPSTVAKDDPQIEIVNPNAIIDISSDSTSSDKKEKAAINFNVLNINKKVGEKNKKDVDDKFCKIISSDGDVTCNEYLNSSEKKVLDFKEEKCKTNFVDEIKLDSNISGSCNNSNVILVPDSDSSCSRGETVSKSELSNKIREPENVSITVTSNNVITNSQFSPSKDSTETSVVAKSISSRSDSVEICDNSVEIINKNEGAVDELTNEDAEDLDKSEPITLRIFKDNNSLHSESGGGSPKRPRLDDSPKQLEFTLKISKDASTNIPKATMSPKRTQSPQRLPDPVPRISSEVSIIPLNFPSQTDKKTGKIVRHGKPSHNEAFDLKEPISIDTMPPKQIPKNADVRVPVTPMINNIPCDKKDLSNFNSVRGNDTREANSIIDIKVATPVEPLVNISYRGTRRGRGNIIPGSVPRRRGRPPKRPVCDAMYTHLSLEESMLAGGTLSSYSPNDTSYDMNSDSPLGRPVRECRDRTRPIIVRQRRPRGGGNSMSRGRGGGRGRGRGFLIMPGRESLSIREQEELARIEARNQQIRLEKLAKREAKMAKKAKRGSSPEGFPPPPLPIPVELTEEEKAELAARREAEAKARAEAAAAAAIEAERLAKEAAAAKEAEKLAKIIARRERLRELHRMKRDKILAKKAAKKLKDEERRKRKQAEKAAEQAAALQNMYEDETRMSAPDGSLRPLYGEESSNRNKTGRMEINLSESKEVSVDQLAEYQWEGGDLYMIQEQVAEYLGVKSFKRKYPDLRRRPVDAEERKYLEETGLVPKSLCDLGITAVSSSEVLDVMYQDFPDKYEEVRKYLREKQMREISSKQRALSLYSKQSDKAKADLRDQAMECVASWNTQLNKERREERKCSMDLQSFIIHYPLSKREVMKQSTSAPGNYPVAVLPGQFCDYYKSYTSNELMYYPMNTVLYGPLKPNERRSAHSDASLSDTETSSSESSSSSSGESDSESEGDEDTKCKICNSSHSSGMSDVGSTSSLQPPSLNGPEIFLPCTKCKLLSHPSCCKITTAMLPHVRKYNWLCTTCKMCVKCNSSENKDKMRLCDLCDRGFHIACLDARKLVPEGKRWHCAICSFCWSCGIREPGGPSNQWLHEFIKDENGEKVYQRSLCAACCANVGREAAAAVAATAAAARAAGSANTNAGTSMAGTSGIVASCSNINSPIRGYQLIQTKDGNQVRVAMTRGVGPMVVRSPGIMGGPRGSISETLVVRSPRAPESVVVRNPMSIHRPRQNIILSPNNRIEMVSSHLSANINGASNNAKK